MKIPKHINTGVKSWHIWFYKCMNKTGMSKVGAIPKAQEARSF